MIQKSVEIDDVSRYIQETVGWLESNNTIHLSDAYPEDTPVVSIREFYTQQERDFIPGVKLENEDDAKTNVREWLSAYSN